MPDYFADDPRTNRERMLAGDLYIADDPVAMEESRRGMQLAKRYSDVFLDDPANAKEILKEMLGSVGENVYIRGPIYVDYGKYISIGDGTFINFNFTALDVAPITIGRDCQFGPNVQLLTPTHPLDPQPRRDKLEAAKPIVIEDNVWLGGAVTVLPGVRIGENSVIGAGSVVTKDVPANSVAVGNPARVIRSI
ncbi:MULTISPECIES: sugar O-acetyltransferase [unclassified Diaminobutyricimonas]|uniref:sugar O-acetyltransferase n=1 Tax=unclassified Diaminobutyricimonas TaxID=2643261 RepID=UPI0012F4E47B|nr:MULTISPECIES: sugar O-acetyltransferase [unclassified Diaminobutyricimonas]